MDVIKNDKIKHREFKPFYSFCPCHGYTRFNKKTNKCMKCSASDRKMKRKFYPN